MTREERNLNIAGVIVLAVLALGLGVMLTVGGSTDGVGNGGPRDPAPPPLTATQEVAGETAEGRESSKSSARAKLARRDR
ncbi:MAG: hypothetical protein ACRDKY_03580, partial [Solirubrobacteraceae bacterium]